MPDEITNAVLAAKLDALRELMELKFGQNEESHKRMDEHMKNLNGQVAKNTEFRVKGSVYLGGAVFLASIIAVSLLKRLGF